MFAKSVYRLITLAGLLSLAGQAYAVVIIGDTEFAVADWSVTEVRDDGTNSTQIATQQATGGNPDAFRQGINTMGGVTVIRYGHLFMPTTYDPSVQGAITSLDWTYDFIVLAATNPTFGAVNSTIVLEQGGIFYLVGPALTLEVDPPDPMWTTNSNSNLTSANFVKVDGVGENPDFSASGGSISFGFLINNSTNQSNGRTTTYGVDNWQFLIRQQSDVPVPTR